MRIVALTRTEVKHVAGEARQSRYQPLAASCPTLDELLVSPLGQAETPASAHACPSPVHGLSLNTMTQIIRYQVQ